MYDGNCHAPGRSGADWIREVDEQLTWERRRRRHAREAARARVARKPDSDREVEHAVEHDVRQLAIERHPLVVSRPEPAHAERIPLRMAL